LLAPGPSLGGARPKASVIDDDKTLAIVKFPKKDDEYNNVLWEAVALSLAKKAKINTPIWLYRNCY
jgi:serine/threonine-protein kinase HipA